MDREKKVKAVYQNVEDVGKNIKTSKKRYTWVFQIDAKVYNLVLDVSMISGKIKLCCNDNIVAMSQQNNVSTFKHSMSVEGCQITVLSQSDTFQLRINNKAFGHMLDVEKNTREFVKSSQSCEDIVVDSKISSSNVAESGLRKTIKLRIGAMKINSNKAANTLESEDWSKMVGPQQNEFPNYFQTQDSSNNSIDYSKVSMKKKNVPQQTPEKLNGQAINLLQSDVHVLEITPQQFSTMQNLFRTQIPTQSTQLSTQSTHQPVQQVEKQSVLTPLNLLQNINLNDFNTMQQMFQTQSFTSIKKQQNESQVLEVNINLQDFNTMQMMFRTMNSNLTVHKTNSQQKMTTCQNAQDLLSSFTNNSCNQQNHQKIVPSNLLNVNMDDFNTMQKMFSTNNLNCLHPNQNLQMSSAADQKIHKKQMQMPNNNLPLPAQLNSLDFSTMANLFKTMNFSLPQEKASTPNNNFKEPNGVQIINTCSSETLQAKNQPLMDLGLSNSSNNVNISNINLNDFNTMQMMFKTNSGLSGVPVANMFSTSFFGPSKGQTNDKNVNQGQLKQNNKPLDSLF